MQSDLSDQVYILYEFMVYTLIYVALCSRHLLMIKCPIFIKKIMLLCVNMEINAADIQILKLLSRLVRLSWKMWVYLLHNSFLATILECSHRSRGSTLQFSARFTYLYKMLKNLISGYASPVNKSECVVHYNTDVCFLQLVHLIQLLYL